ncbi:MAG TPA: PQQ-binding-like beta-propeller repeat protein [Vicinamibacterales bacterium]|jgi:polyvinyl alcohol dehydrogenase (cytochrome)
MKTRLLFSARVVAALLFAAGAASAQTASGTIRSFEEHCATCHRNPGVARAAGAEQAPDVDALRKLSPDTVFAAITMNPTPAHAKAVADLTDIVTRGYAEFLGGRKIGSTPAGDPKAMPNQCPASAKLTDPSAGPSWNGWSADATNARFQSAKAAGITAAQVPGLKLKWAFGLPNAASMYSQPTVAGGRVFFGADTGYVYALDAKTGCVAWGFQATAGVRNAPSVGPVKGRAGSSYAAYFGDLRGNVYALDAATGKALWIVSVDPHPLAAVTGSPILHKGRLYVPLASREEAAGGGPDYPCCTFRGSVVALDADTGKQIWKTHIISGEPKPTKKNSRGVQLYAPSGGGIWDTPTIDEGRGALYIGTGDAYSRPVSATTTDAVMALDLATGKPRWTVQHTPDDAWLVGCETNNPSENCPANIGPDWDFGDSPIMRTLNDGRTIVISGQKSGEVYAQDVRDGKVIWKATLVEKLARGEITFGGAADDQRVYFGTRSGAVWALDLKTGEKKWTTPVAPIPQRQAGQTAALTVIPGVVFSGGQDGVLRAFAAADGKQVWEFDTVRDFTTTNGVAARGGAMGAPGPTVAGGMLFLGSGYTGLGNGRGGNVLLAFEADESRSTR